MSSFKKKGSAKSAAVALPGTRPSPATPSTLVTSTGIPSLDDILGGGLPLSCSLLILAPDYHTSYGQLVQKYFVAQGLSCGQNVCIVDNSATDFAGDIMWIPSSSSKTAEDDLGFQENGEDMKIAWRYANMKQFQTTVTSAPQHDAFVHTFDLGTRIPEWDLDEALQSGQLLSVPVTGIKAVLERIAEVLRSSLTTRPLRICIPSLGSVDWENVTGQDVLYFLHALRALLQRYSHACASVTLSCHLSTDWWGGSGWTHKQGWICDAAITLAAFSGNPSLSSAFPLQHGFVHIHSLPAPHTLSPPSDKFSTLRGLSSSTGPSGGSGENNLAFRCTRKRFIFETLHLGLEGGVSERRTTPSASSAIGDGGEAKRKEKSSRAKVEVIVEEDERRMEGEKKVKKEKKKVGFRSDRPELYDF
ncbi:hypothetical protein AMATHDRAFT_169238 [Amanita thiersii Skay4041]|uniref:Elongator complex protein 4 n=1 Tax=Amanita thiersii Skay4041 TaxID=703135 RepID=A0A2A9NYH4_9AGAR|nr:hypothetical protein AMATHDRAFT_169238 [Amanita thiersii Skay4041]